MTIPHDPVLSAAHAQPAWSGLSVDQQQMIDVFIAATLDAVDSPPRCALVLHNGLRAGGFSADEALAVAQSASTAAVV